MHPAHLSQTQKESGQKLKGVVPPEVDPLLDELEVSPSQVKAMLDEQQDFVLVDCRTPQEVQFARIEGAKWIPFQDLAHRHNELAEFKKSPMVVYCHHGVRSLQIAIVLRQRGFSSVKSMAGGIDLWAKDIDQTIARY